MIGRVRAYLGLKEPVGHAADVGCGTGQSAVSLAAVARCVVGVDASKKMLAHATPHHRVRYVGAPAERLPLAAASFDLVTAGLAFHWFDRTAFLAEARRVLRPGGSLVIYQNGFAGRMAENEAYHRWDREQYVKRYPTPARNAQPLSDDDAAAAGFRFAGRESYANEVAFSPDELIAYLLTQTNVIAAVERGSETVASAADWIARGVRPLFRAARATFPLGGTIWYLKKA